MKMLLALSLSLVACSRGGGGSNGTGTTPPPPPPPTLTITTSTLPGGTVGTTYSAPLAATGGAPPYTWSMIAGSLPAGLTLAGGTISGTPATPGTSTFTVQATDGALADAQALSITISAAGGTLTITTTTLPTGTVGTPYTAALAATGGAPPYAWSVVAGSLPAGLALSSATISGTPTTPGASSFTVQAADGTLTDTQPLSITINSAGGGSGWSTVAVGTSQTLYGVDFKNSTGFIVGMTQTILKTIDGGATWAPATSGFYSATNNTTETSAHILSPPPAWGTYHLLCVRMVDENVVWMSSAGPLAAPNPSYGPSSLGACFVTSNGGTAWTRVVMATNFQVWGVSGWDASNARAASIGSSSHTDSDIYTISGAKDTSHVAMIWNALYDIQMVSPTVGFAAGDTIHKTTNGSGWNATSAPGGQYRAVCFLDGTTGWAVADGGKIIKTVNGSTSWATQPSGTTQDLWGISFIDASNGWAVGKAGTVLRTTDGGTTWAAETSGTTNDLYEVKALSATTAWAVGATGTVLKRQ